MRGTCKNTRLYEGKPCNKCSTTWRYESTGTCVECTRAEARSAYQRNSIAVLEHKRVKYKTAYESHLNTVLKCNYDISLEEYNDLLNKQNGVCAICEKACSTGRRLCVDHDHKTNKVRGLLCLNCNRGIGNFKDSISTLRNATAYLENSGVN